MGLNRGEISGWMDRASSGDDEAFALLTVGVQDDLFRFALAHGLVWADAAEAVQEVLLRAYNGRRRWRKGSDAVAWVYGIAMNVVREFRRRPRPAALDGRVIPAAEHGDDDDEALGRLAEALDELPPRQRESVTCRYLRRMSVSDTAAAMGCAEGTVKASLSAAMKKLRAALGRQLD